MTWCRVSPAEMARIRALAAGKKAKRVAKAADIWADKPAKVKRKKSLTVADLEETLWNICSLYIRRRDTKANNGLCFYCEKNPIQCAMHRIKRGRRATKFDERNLHGGCFLCNGLDGPFNQSQKFDAIFIRKLGVELFLELEAKSREFCERDPIEILRLTEYFKKKLGEVKP